MKIKKLMQHAQASGEKIFIPFIPAGYPTLEKTEQSILDIYKLGVQVIELGIPYSDPGADGPTIVNAYDHAIKNGVTLQACLNLVKRIRNRGCKIGIILFSYYNPILALGEQAFTKLAHDSGVDSVLIVDLPVEESTNLKKQLDSHSIGLIQLATPTTPPERLSTLTHANPDFIYYVSRTGVTGSQKSISETLAKEVLNVKSTITTPIAIGFGISSPSQAQQISNLSEAIIVGSTLVELMHDYQKYLSAVKSFQLAVTGN